MRGSTFARRTPLAGGSTRRGGSSGSPARLGREFSLEWGDQSRVRAVRGWYEQVETADARRELLADGENAESVAKALPETLGARYPVLAAVQVVWETDDRQWFTSPIIGGDLSEERSPDAELELAHTDILNGIVATYDGRHLSSLGFVTQDGVTAILGARVGLQYRWTLAEGERTGFAGALVTGLYGFHLDGTLCGLGLRCNVDGVGPTVMPWGPGGRVVPIGEVGVAPGLDAANVPAAPSEHEDNADRLDHVGAPTPARDRPNPCHRTLTVMRVDQWDDLLRIHSSDHSVAEYRFVTSRFDRRERCQMDLFAGGDGHGDGIAVTVGADEPRIEFANGAVLVAPVVPVPSAADGPTWDNVFSLDHRVDYLAWSSRGIDVSRLAPFDLQASVGALRQPIFATPPSGSRGFHIADNGKATVVPNGWHFVGDVAGSTGSRTTSAFSDEESRRTWATSLGISAGASAEVAGVGAKIAYTNNSAAHDAVSTASTGKVVSTIVESVESSHSLVVDLATVELAAGFRRAVVDLALRPTASKVADFVARFGTHFAYAVCFGSKSWEQSHETEASVADSMTHGTSQSRSVSGDVSGGGVSVSAGVSWGAEGESSVSSTRGTGSQVSARGSVGSASEPVPIMLDARDITDLLTPVFFDDPEVWQTVLPAVNAYLDEFPQGPPYDDNPGELNFDILPPPPAGYDRTVQPTLYNVGGDLQWFCWERRFALDDEVFTLLAGRPRGGTTPLTAPAASDDMVRSYQLDPRPLTVEGMVVVDELKQRWLLRGGRRHLDRAGSIGVPRMPAAQADTPAARAIVRAILDRYPDSGEPVTNEGKLLCAGRDSREVWLVRQGQRHRVPSEAMIEVLGGWSLVVHVPVASSLLSMEIDPAPASVDGQMIRLAGDPQVWVIHDRKRHRVVATSGVQKRGGWQRVAVVADDVIDWFPDSGTPAL